MQLAVGSRGFEAREARYEPAHAELEARADLQRKWRGLAATAAQLGAARELCQHLARVRQHPFAGGRERDAPGSAREEHAADLLFELFDAPAKGRRRQRYAARGRAEVELFGGGDEAAQGFGVGEHRTRLSDNRLRLYGLAGQRCFMEAGRRPRT